MNKLIQDICNKRQTVKAYSDRQIASHDWESILSAIYWSPSSMGFEPYRVLVINRANALRQELLPAIDGQTQAVEADKLVFFIALDRNTFTSEKWIESRLYRKLVEIANKDEQESRAAAHSLAQKISANFEKVEPNGNEWSICQTYIALTSGVLAAAILNIGSTILGGMDRVAVKSILKKYKLMEDNEVVSIAAAFGYPKDDTAYAHYGSGKRIRDKWEDKFKEI